LKIRRRFVASAVAVAVAVGAGILVAPRFAAAHGATLIPGSRTYLCWVDGLRQTGEIIPFNPACADAVAQGGQQPLYDWFGVLRSDGGGRTNGFIPDGQICGGGTTKYAAYNMARTDWPTTHLTSGATIQFRHSNWAAHPGRFDLYVTRDGWNPNTPLAWADLLPFWTSVDPPQSGPPGALNYYFWNAQLPSSKTGRHIIFAHWIRSDSMENFYSCSDVVFDGGNGEVTGVGPGGTASPRPSTSVSSSPAPSSPAPSASPSTSPSQPSSGNCTATWAIMPTNWPGHFQAQVTVRNTGTSNFNGWTVRWSYTGGQGFEGPPWNAVVTGQPPDVVVRNADWNRVVAPNGTTSFGFNATGTAPNPAPTLTCTSP
jgi:predicted carbohydrate-binding protein with CBM5 and CBM33 domain